MFGTLKNHIKSLVYTRIPCPFEPTFSQSGEDKIISWLFNDKSKTQISYLDIGTNHPIDCNNTYKFYRNGCRGVCVEADPSLLDNIKKHRPLDKILNVAVSAGEATTLRFYVFNDTGHSTIVEDEALKRQKAGCRIKNTIDVPALSINNIIEQNFSSYPEFLSLDVEGHDLAVLKSLDFNSFPIPVICVETCSFSLNHVRPKDLSISDYLTGKNYFSYADTYINTIFVNKDWFYTT